MKINLAVNLDIHSFSGSGINEYESGLTNCVIHKSADKMRITQRPSIDMSEDTTDGNHAHLVDRGRGLYYWEQNNTLYIVHDKEVYKDSQLVANKLSANITTGSERVTILEDQITPLLIILDSENNKGWTMATNETVTQITDAQFPSTLAHGGAVLDNYLFVMDEDGYIYNSNVGDPTAWEALDVINTERSPDKGVYLGKHHEHIVAFGTRSIEFFYDAGNASASPLNRRADISFNVGLASGTAVWENGDVIYFLGSNLSGQIDVYQLVNFQISKISNDSMSSYMTSGITRDDLKFIFNGLSVMGKDTLLITVYALSGSPSVIVPKVTFSYDSTSGFFGLWTTELNNHTTFPLIGWTRRVGGQSDVSSARAGEGLLYNGDVIKINDRLRPIDTIQGEVFIQSVFESDTFEELTDEGTNISLVARTGLQDGGIVNYKFQSKETVPMESTEASQTLTVKHSDETTSNFDAGNTIDTSLTRKDIHQGGRFVKRSYQIEYSGDEQIFLESLDIELMAGM